MQEYDIAEEEVHFQYPLSDRTHCNYRRQTIPTSPFRPFSILYRIEPTVTLAAKALPQIIESFSILYRIEPTVTGG